MLSFSFLPSKVVKTDPIAVNNGRGVGVGCMVQGLDGNMCGKVVRDGGHEWILQSAGRVAAKGDELVRWRWMPSSQPSALGRSRRKGKVGAAATAAQQSPQVAGTKGQAAGTSGKDTARGKVAVHNEQAVAVAVSALQRENMKLQAEVARLTSTRADPADNRGRGKGKGSTSAGVPSSGRVVTVPQPRTGRRRRGGGGRGGGGGV